jgi:hypothetical protein
MVERAGDKRARAGGNEGAAEVDKRPPKGSCAWLAAMPREEGEVVGEGGVSEINSGMSQRQHAVERAVVRRRAAALEATIRGIGKCDRGTSLNPTGRRAGAWVAWQVREGRIAANAAYDAASDESWAVRVRAAWDAAAGLSVQADSEGSEEEEMGGPSGSKVEEAEAEHGYEGPMAGVLQE